jgi:tRNA modification GTPase
LQKLCGKIPPARHATLAALKHPDSGQVIDNGLVIFFQGPASATGEDVAEFHLHGGRAVVRAMLATLSGIDGLRAAEPGEFTRRAFDNGRLDLTETEGLADLLAAETETQRRAAMAMAGGALTRQIDAWQQQLLALAARIEAILDFSDEDEVGEALPGEWRLALAELARNMAAALARPPAERLRDGVRIVIAGPPNAGKSTLLNALAQREAAIVSPVPGTTRDVVEVPLAIAGVPMVLADTAGLRDSAEAVEAIGIERAGAQLASADIILWLGPRAECPLPDKAICIRAKADLGGPAAEDEADLALSARSGIGMDALGALLAARATDLLPAEGEVAFNARHRVAVEQAVETLREAASTHDPLVAAESLRQARVSLDGVTGRAGFEDMLDALFGRFCVGK